MKVFFGLLFVGALGLAYYHFIYAPAHTIKPESAYVLPPSLDVVDTTAALRSVVGTLKAGVRVDVLARTTNWTEVRSADGVTGWVESKNLLDEETYQRGQKLLRTLEDFGPQAAGHTSSVINLHLEPSRDSIVLAQLPQNQNLQVFARELVARPVEPNEPKSNTAVRDAWYLVRAGPRAGWVLGRLIDLDVPAGIETYAEGINVVGWQVLRTVNDGGQRVPEYLVADRIGTEDVDFNHIRAFTWWVKHHKYVTAYVESNLNGFFPIRVTHPTNSADPPQDVPYFRLRLIASDGHKFQRVYGMFDTIVRPVGTVDGWESQAMPEHAAPASKPGRRKRGRARR